MSLKDNFSKGNYQKCIELLHGKELNQIKRKVLAKCYIHTNQFENALQVGCYKDYVLYRMDRLSECQPTSSILKAQIAFKENRFNDCLELLEKVEQDDDVICNKNACLYFLSDKPCANHCDTVDNRFNEALIASNTDKQKAIAILEEIPRDADDYFYVQLELLNNCIDKPNDEMIAKYKELSNRKSVKFIATNNLICLDTFNTTNAIKKLGAVLQSTKLNSVHYDILWTNYLILLYNNKQYSTVLEKMGQVEHITLSMRLVEMYAMLKEKVDMKSIVERTSDSPELQDCFFAELVANKDSQVNALLAFVDKPLMKLKFILASKGPAAALNALSDSDNSLDARIFKILLLFRLQNYDECLSCIHLLEPSQKKNALFALLYSAVFDGQNASKFADSLVMPTINVDSLQFNLKSSLKPKSLTKKNKSKKKKKPRKGVDPNFVADPERWLPKSARKIQAPKFDVKKESTPEKKRQYDKKKKDQKKKGKKRADGRF